MTIVVFLRTTLERLTFDLWPLALSAALSLSIGALAFRRQVG
jgi:hypothetical protein